MKYLLLVICLGLVGCERNTPPAAAASTLTPGKRTELHLPQADEPVDSNQLDIAAARALTRDVQDATNEYLKSRYHNFAIVAARPVGKYMLLWVAINGMADSGVDLIYSVEEQKIVGEFNGGIRG